MDRYAVTFLFLFLLIEPVAARDTYILFDVKVENHRNDDPVWLAVERESGVQHWRIEGHIFEVDPGEYRIDHIDFHKVIKFRHGSLNVPKKTPVKFTVRPGFINFLGTLNVQKERGSISLTFSAEPSLVDLACQIKPEVFSKMEVVVVLLPEVQTTHRVVCDY